MKKILMAAPFDAKGRYSGGICAIANSILEREDVFTKEGVEVVKFDTCRVARKSSTMSKINVENIKNSIKIYKDLTKELKKSKAECLYYHTSVRLALFKDLLAIKRAKKKTGAFVVIHIHFADYEKIMTNKSILDSCILRIIKKYVDRIVFLSKNTMEQFVNKGVDRNKCRVIYNFATTSFSEEEIANKRLSKERKEFLFVGSIDERKGLFDALECFSNVEGDYVLNVCGGFPSSVEENKYKEYEKKLGNKLVFHGFVKGDEKKKVFLNSDIFLLPSYGEGLPVVILEAFSAGCAVITTSVGAIPEIVDSENGIVIDCGDKKKLLEAIEYYIKASRDEICLQQRKNYEKSREYTIENFIEQLCDACKI